ncbi:glycosyltransferase family 2 protein [Bremerella alba]|uniref:Glycosyltransferase 2-like domain-containing protein n=1 Tax=Bremerella alba TaxID=980252 RepID=A0A7V8V583_9BACT|nr:glycosyltransferase [Bremerella alba]MBA2115173.1 hypothetical protein [Bremerella alba]
MGEDPIISVVVPLPDDRGHVLDCLTGFTQQTLEVPFEVIVPTEAASSSEVAWLVDRFPQVRWIHRPGLKVNALYNVGAAAARGEYLYISESHCVPRSDCLQQIFDFVQQSGLPAACSASDGINANYVAEGEQRIFEEDFHRWMEAKKCKIAIRGTLIERALWEQVGGFQAEFGHFSEMLIGCRLEAVGARFGFAANSYVSHGNQVCLKSLSEELIEYGEDECRSCHLTPAEMRIADTKEWADRELLKRQSLWLRFRQAKEAVRQWARAVAIQTLPLPAEWRFQVFRRYWQSAIRQGRLRYLASMTTFDATSEEIAKPSDAYRKAA